VNNRTFDSQTQAAAVLKIPLAEIRAAKREGCSAFVGSRIREKPLVDLRQGTKWDAAKRTWIFLFTGPEFVPTAEQTRVFGF